MSSCYKKNVNIEKYAEPPRTPYDQLMNKVYNSQNYYASPMPMQRTKFDMDMLKHWCPNCNFGFTVTPDSSINKKEILNPATTEFYGNPPRTPYDQLMDKVYNPQTYYAAPFPMERTIFDMDIKKIWCPKCKYGFTPTPSSSINKKEILNPATTEFYTRNNFSRENYCGASPNNVALALEDNDNVWSYNAKNM